MKTFSAMSTPDKKLTYCAFEKLLDHFQEIVVSKNDIPEESKQIYRQKSVRIRQLMDAIEEELLQE